MGRASIFSRSELCVSSGDSQEDFPPQGRQGSARAQYAGAFPSLLTLPRGSYDHIAARFTREVDDVEELRVRSRVQLHGGLSSPTIIWAFVCRSRP